MRICRHELKRGRLALLIWTLSVACMLGVCVLIYPEMEAEMEQVTDLFSGMGGFSAAFGMDRLNFGEFIGFFCVECGNVLGIGGAFFAALTGITMLSKEEKEHTAEFLLARPVSRARVYLEKGIAILVQLLIFTGINLFTALLCMRAADLKADTHLLLLLFAAYFLMQVETAAVTYCISAFLKRGGAGIGIGLAALFYFMNITANLTEKAEGLRYVTPFGYTEGADIVLTGTLQMKYLRFGMAAAALALLIGCIQYMTKDLS